MAIDKLDGFLRRHHIKMAIITVPSDSAQEVADRLVRAGVDAILNFSPVVLHLPGNVVSSNVNLAIELENLSYFRSIAQS
jgi:redox-sensing transcriptional repressor